MKKSNVTTLFCSSFNWCHFKKASIRKTAQKAHNEHFVMPKCGKLSTFEQLRFQQTIFHIPVFFLPYIHTRAKLCQNCEPSFCHLGLTWEGFKFFPPRAFEWQWRMILSLEAVELIYWPYLLTSVNRLFSAYPTKGAIICEEEVKVNLSFVLFQRCVTIDIHIFCWTSYPDHKIKPRVQWVKFKLETTAMK